MTRIGRWGSVALAAMALTGCMEGGGGLFAGAGTGGTDAHAAASVQVMSKGFTIAGPRGYCIDPGATRDGEAGAFVVLGSCAVISGNPRDAKPRRPAILTASVTPADGPVDAAALDRMAGFFSTESGRAALARSESADAATVIDLSRDDGLVLVHAEDGDSAGDVTGDYWRGVFAAAGQLVTVTVSGFRDAPLDTRTGAALAQSFVTAIRRANPAAPTAEGEPAAATGGGLASFFNRLL